MIRSIFSSSGCTSAKTGRCFGTRRLRFGHTDCRRMFHFVRSCAAGALLLGGAGVFVACTDAVRLGRDLGVAGTPPAPGGGAGGREFPIDGAGAGGIDASPAPTPAPPPDAGPCVVVSCGGAARECGDCSDDDGDGWIDASDPECLGPCDDSEGELFSGATTNITGSCRADCYFDLNSGSGDDGCNWSYRCDPRSVAPEFYPTGSPMCEHDATLATCNGGVPPESCQSSCRPLTPNGCDCFGCCELPAASGRFVWIGAVDEASHCELTSSADPSACRPCTPVLGCQNACDECELCVGKATLPPSCSEAAGPSCPSGVRSCDPRALGACGPLAYCITGCCMPLPT